MVETKPTRYSAPNLRIYGEPVHSEVNTKFVRIYSDYVEAQSKLRENVKHSLMLLKLNIWTEASRQNLFAQAISAVHSYPPDRRLRHRDFHPYVFLTEPDTSKFLVGELNGAWNETGDAFELKEVKILDYRSTIAGAVELESLVHHLNPATPIVASDSFSQALEAQTKIA